MLQKTRETGKKNNEITKRAFASHKVEVEKFNTTIADLQAQITALTTERDELRTKTQETVSVSAKEQELTQELADLRQEKAQLEQRLQEAAAADQPAVQTTELETEVVCNHSAKYKLNLTHNA
jgi:uncharacterized coiled-coil DUF342 family protein